MFLAKDRSRNKKQLIVIDHYVPHYDQDAGSRSTFSYLVLFLKLGYKVTFIGDNFYKHEPYTSKLQQLGVEVLYGNFYFNNIQQWLKENGKFFTHAFLHRMHIAPKYINVLKKHSNAKLIYIGHDLQFVSSKRKYEITKEQNHLIDAEKFKKLETYIFNNVDIICPFSTYEAPFIRKIVPMKVTEVIPVNFYEKLSSLSNSFEKRKDILFVGGFGHPPNIDAILWFVKDIFSLIIKKIPDLKLHIVGSKPTKEVLDLKSSKINVTGLVSDQELERFYSNCRVAVIPLRIGAGVKGKLLEACYYQIPSVITSVAAEGVPNIKDYCIIDDNPVSFAQKTIQLYSDKVKWEKQFILSGDMIRNNYSEAITIDILTNKILL